MQTDYFFTSPKSFNLCLLSNDTLQVQCCRHTKKIPVSFQNTLLKPKHIGNFSIKTFLMLNKMHRLITTNTADVPKNVTSNGLP